MGRAKARQNFQVATVNAALERQLITCISSLLRPSWVGTLWRRPATVGTESSALPARSAGWSEKQENVYRLASIITAVTKVLSDLTIVPNGFGVQPTKDGYDFHRECEQVFGKRRTSLALLWQIYSGRRSLQIHFRQCGHRCGGSRAKNSRMAWRTAGKVG